jgi:hypothetical protein
MKTLLWVCFSGTLVLGGAAAADQNLSREAVVYTALQDNPTVKAARAKWEMMKARVPQAIAWEDLRVGVDSVAGRFVSIPANAFMDQTVMVEQELPSPERIAAAPGRRPRKPGRRSRSSGAPSSM